jgi:hypothetical protein
MLGRRGLSAAIAMLGKAYVATMPTKQRIPANQLQLDGFPPVERSEPRRTASID